MAGNRPRHLRAGGISSSPAATGKSLLLADWSAADTSDPPQAPIRTIVARLRQPLGDCVWERMASAVLISVALIAVLPSRPGHSQRRRGKPIAARIFARRPARPSRLLSVTPRRPWAFSVAHPKLAWTKFSAPLAGGSSIACQGGPLSAGRTLRVPSCLDRPEEGLRFTGSSQAAPASGSARRPQ